jgi:3-deoxy-D-manno-octulosonic-acid transferase
MIYDLALALYFFPRFLYERILLRKKRSFLLQRLGLRSYPPLENRRRPLIWIHAVSVGETKSASLFLHKLKKSYPEATFVVSSVTETGHEEAKRSLKEADLHLFLPFDFSFAIRRLLKIFPIDLLIFVETDLWYNFIRLVKKRGAKVFLISGKMSKRSCKNYRLFPKFSKRLFSLFDGVFCQNHCFQERFLSAGVSKEKVCVTGNLKFDLAATRISEEEKKQWLSQFTSSLGDSFLTISCTHSKEEEGILEALLPLLQMRKEIKILLAPRHPERFSAVAKLLKQKGFSFTPLSQLERDKQIILIDRLGFLPVCYSLSKLAILGGSFVDKIGGHNILEPISYQIPVCFGPYMFAQEEMVAHVLQKKCGFQMSLSDLGPLVFQLFTDPRKLEELSKNCLSFLETSQPALETLHALKRSLKKFPSPLL